MKSGASAKQSANSTPDVLDTLARRGRRWHTRLAQLDHDEARRVCLRCGGDAYQDGDGWRCWKCGQQGGDGEA